LKRSPNNKNKKKNNKMRHEISSAVPDIKISKESHKLHVYVNRRYRC